MKHYFYHILIGALLGLVVISTEAQNKGCYRTIHGKQVWAYEYCGSNICERNGGRLVNNTCIDRKIQDAASGGDASIDYNLHSKNNQNSSTSNTEGLTFCQDQCKGSGSPDRIDQCVKSCEADQVNMGPHPTVEVDQGTVRSCLAELEQIRADCETAKSEAISSCDQEKDEGMNDVMGIAKQAALLLGQVTSGTNLACTKMASLAQAANAAVLGFQGNCQSAIGGCTDKCAAVTDFIKQNKLSCFTGTVESILTQTDAYTEWATTRHASCKSLDAKVQQASLAMNNITQTNSAAAACAQNTTALPTICATNPTAVGCTNAIVDCSSPAMANDLVCKCQRTNNADPACYTAMKGSGQVGGSADYSSRMAAGNTTTSLGGEDIPGLDQISPGSKSPSRARGLDGKVGGGAGIGGGDSGGGGGSGSGSGAGYGGEEPLRVTAGFYGAGGAAGAMGGRGGPGGAGGYVGRRAATSATGGPDLRAFMPGGQYDPRQRGIAGATGVDGITGPHTNIWHKIQNRYQATSPTLLP